MTTLRDPPTELEMLQLIATSELQPHPLGETIYAEETVPQDFLDEIRTRGIRVPLVVREDGTIISGHRRWRAAKKLGIGHVPAVQMEFADEAGELEAIIGLNKYRTKNFSQKMREAEVLFEVERQRAEERQKNLGRTHGLDPSGKISGRGETRDKVAEVVGVGSGRTYDKARRVWEAAKGDGTLAKTARDCIEKLDRGALSVSRAYRKVKEVERRTQDKRRVDCLPPAGDRFQVMQSGVEELKLKPESIDAIITDPPYAGDLLWVYEALAKLAATSLKPGGSLLVMTGQVHLPKVLALMTPHISYHSVIAYIMGGERGMIHALRIFPGWKPVLWFVKGQYTGKPAVDVVRGSGSNKAYHPHGQCPEGFEQLVEKVTRPGDLILDPFSGGGTTGVAALNLNRRFVGSDRDPEAVETTIARLHAVADELAISGGQGEAAGV